MVGKNYVMPFWLGFVFCLPTFFCLCTNLIVAEEILPFFGGDTMGTTYSVKFRHRVKPDDKQAALRAIQNKVESRLLEINQSMSTYIADSEISQFNKHRGTDWFTVSEDFISVAKRAGELNRLTEGKLDVTVSPLVRFWGFGGGQKPAVIPSPEAVANVLKNIGASKLDANENSVRKQIGALEIDFSAIAKGYAVDQICKLMDEFSDNYLVEIGGEVRGKGRKSNDSEKPWIIGIETPASLKGVIDQRLASRAPLDSRAMATSGDYRNFVVIEGKRFQHTIDPVSGFPVDRGILSVSIVADDCMTADGIATGLMVHSLGKIKEICSRNGIAAFVIYQDENGGAGWWKSEAFEGEVLLSQSGKKADDRAKENATNPLWLIVGTMIVFGLAIAGMAIGVIVSNRQLKGSCGGLSAMSSNGETGASPCSLCTKPVSECSRRSEQEEADLTPTS